MRIVFIGDIVGRTGREGLFRELPVIVERVQPDIVIVNGENAAGGFGITEEIAIAVHDAGCDVITLGNHAFDQREALVFIERATFMLRPVNYPSGTPGRGAGLFETRRGQRVLVMNVMGVAKMEPLGDPFAAVERELSACPLGEGCDAAVIDFHAELTSEKMAMGHFADGRASLVVGTHTHVPTGDCQILPGGTAYQTDAGMCGDYDSVIGMDKEEPLNRFLRKIPQGRFTPATGQATVCGVAVETDDRTGLALKAAPFRLGGRLQRALPDFG
jgi:metallophosphoesterase (TIGR00282 family)